MMAQVRKVSRDRLERNNTAGATDEPGRSQRVVPNVRTHVEDDLPGPNDLPEQSYLFMLVATEPAPVSAGADDPPHSGERPLEHGYGRARRDQTQGQA